MMKNFAAFVLASLLVAVSIHQNVRADPLEQDISRQCIKTIAQDLDKITIPDEPKQLEFVVRYLNPFLNPDVSLTVATLSFGYNASVRSMLVGSMSPEKINQVVKGCVKFINEVYEKLESTDCGKVFLKLNKDSPWSFFQILRDEPKIERVVGYARVCQ